MTPLDVIPVVNQRVAHVLDNRRCTLTFRYNKMIDRWTFDLGVDAVMVLHGRKVVHSVNLLEPFSLGLGAIVAIDFAGTGEPPGWDAVVHGRTRLYHVSEAEVAFIRAGAAG